MPKTNCISKPETSQNELENTPNDLKTLQEALKPLGWNQARIKCLAAFLVAILTVQSVNLVKIAKVFPTQAAKSSASTSASCAAVPAQSKESVNTSMINTNIEKCNY